MTLRKTTPLVMAIRISLLLLPGLASFSALAAVRYDIAAGDLDKALNQYAVRSGITLASAAKTSTRPAPQPCAMCCTVSPA